MAVTVPPPSSEECEACQTLKDLGYNEPMRGTDPHHALIAALRDRLEKAEASLRFAIRRLEVPASEDATLEAINRWEADVVREARLALKSAKNPAEVKP